MSHAIYELLLDALRRRLVVVLLLLSSLIIGGISYGLDLEVVDGAIASAKVFGQIVNQSEEGSLNLSGIMTVVRVMWFAVITLICLVLSSGTVTDWMKDSYSVFLLQSGLSRLQVYLGILFATWILLGVFIGLTTVSLEILLETKLSVEISGLKQSGLAAWAHLLSLLSMCFALLPRRSQWQGAMVLSLLILLLGFAPQDVPLGERPISMTLFSVLPLGSEWVSWLLLEEQAIATVPRISQIDYGWLWFIHALGWTCFGLGRIQNREFSDRDE